jgi:hypothetical protein
MQSYSYGAGGGRVGAPRSIFSRSLESIRFTRCSLMARRKETLNERRLTRRQVQELIASDARPRPDLAAAFEQTFSTGCKDQPLVYELDGERYLLVFDPADPDMGVRATSMRPTPFIVSCDGRRRSPRTMSKGAEARSSTGPTTRR